MVGLPGFEPGAPCSQSRCATKLRHNPYPHNVAEFDLALHGDCVANPEPDGRRATAWVTLATEFSAYRRVCIAQYALSGAGLLHR